ncbi:hypothetical protein [Deminuibacter soli]|uniref:Lipoprotein n=1 Tax=Deminuibacter soli TaxID=2291815 RepID=A0A3E1NPJ2_9BACT|nr:hypothetical protein [Deminuibacter soli]RFM29855.1 hypothetical protein DXN05_02450 [Deminuibacter soli]
MRNFAIISSLLLGITACSVKERVQLNANNSVNRTMEFNLDSGAAAKFIAIAQQQGQPAGGMDSISYAWDSLAANIKKTALQIPGATAESTPWNKATRTGTLNFKMPTLEGYNDFAANTLNLPNDMDEKVPVGGLKRQNLTWHGKDTLVITLDNSHPGAAEHAAETQQAMGLVKVMIGLEALLQYKSEFILPRAAKSVVGENAQLSQDKKKVLFSKSLDEPNAEETPDVIKVIF